MRFWTKCSEIGFDAATLSGGSVMCRYGVCGKSYSAIPCGSLLSDLHFSAVQYQLRVPTSRGEIWEIRGYSDF